ncbi:MAG: hypothetical protein Fur0010_17980 [Bdellovibrio sp.]
MAQAVAKKLSPKDWDIRSAGSFPAENVNPIAVEVLNDSDYETRELYPKHWDKFPPNFFINLDFIIRVCDGELCPPLTSKNTKVLNWPIKDPASSNNVKDFQDVLHSIEDKWIEFLKRYNV